MESQRLMQLGIQYLERKKARVENNRSERRAQQKLFNYYFTFNSKYYTCLKNNKFVTRNLNQIPKCLTHL